MAEAEKQYSKETTSFLLKEKIADMIKYGKKLWRIFLEENARRQTRYAEQC